MSVMFDKHKELLRKNLVGLVSDIELDQTLWNALIAAGILTPAQRKKIELNRIPDEQIGELLELLKRRDDDAFYKFCQCLHDTGQVHVVDKYLDDGSDISGKIKTRESKTSDAFRGRTPDRELSGQSTGASAEVEVEDIDLDDGEYDVQVKLCDKEFYDEKHSKAYPMYRASRGHALIISVTNVLDSEPRTGTNVDCNKLQQLFTKLEYGHVTVYKDEDGLKSQEIAQKIGLFLEQVPDSAQSCAVCVLTHGGDNKLKGTDGKSVEVNAIINLFNEKKAPNLAGKPKMLVLQACRGGATDAGQEYSDDESDDIHPTGSDLVICYPTVQGYKAWRNKKRGSWYIAALVQVFEKYACRDNIGDLLTQVNYQVSKKTSRNKEDKNKDKKKQTAEFVSRLTKKWYFFPGYVKASQQS